MSYLACLASWRFLSPRWSYPSAISASAAQRVNAVSSVASTVASSALSAAVRW